jgi:hypothetical protein
VVQDSLRDWETESSKMGSIYQNSYITISATNSGDGSRRCLAERRKPVKIPYENTAKKEFALRARKVLDHHPKDNPDGGPARPIGPLSHRAWALQETVLSTRVLHYTATELLFECKTSYRCECAPDRRVCPTTPSLIPKAVSSKDKHAIWDTWQRIVEKYSARNLTVASDKLPAISGIASKIRKATHSDYMAGLWKSNLASDLLWSASSPPSITAGRYALDSWRAPSFSWASLDTAVAYAQLDEKERDTFKDTITLLTASIKPKGMNALGTLSDASITIRGPVTKATLSAEQNRGVWTYMLMIKGTSTITITPDCLLVNINIKTEDDGEQRSVRRARSDDSIEAFHAPVLCLTVANYDNLVAGLVLGISESNPEMWERTGTFAAGMEAIQNSEEQVLNLA